MRERGVARGEREAGDRERSRGESEAMRATSRGERDAMSATPGQRPQNLVKKVGDVLALIQSDYEALVTGYYARCGCHVHGLPRLAARNNKYLEALMLKL